MLTTAQEKYNIYNRVITAAPVRYVSPAADEISSHKKPDGDENNSGDEQYVAEMPLRDPDGDIVGTLRAQEDTGIQESHHGQAP